MKFKDKPVVLGYTELEPYTDNKFYYGAVIGRFANRLKNGQAKLSQGTIQAEINTDTGHHIHGGSKGSCNKNWRILEQSKSYVVLESSPANKNLATILGVSLSGFSLEAILVNKSSEGIKVKGKVVEVCKAEGCWIKINDGK